VGTVTLKHQVRKQGLHRPRGLLAWKVAVVLDTDAAEKRDSQDAHGAILSPG